MREQDALAHGVIDRLVLFEQSGKVFAADILDASGTKFMLGC